MQIPVHQTQKRVINIAGLASARGAGKRGHKRATFAAARHAARTGGGGASLPGGDAYSAASARDGLVVRPTARGDGPGGSLLQ